MLKWIGLFNISLVLMLFFRCLSAVCCSQQLYLMKSNNRLPFHISAPLCILSFCLFSCTCTSAAGARFTCSSFVAPLTFQTCFVYQDAPHSCSVPPTSLSLSDVLVWLTSCCWSHMQVPQAVQKLLFTANQLMS